MKQYATITYALLLVALALNGCSTSTQAHFTQLPDVYTHKWTDTDTTFPFTGAAAVDVDGDGTKEIFVGGGKGQPDALLRFQQDTLVDVIADSGLSGMAATYGVLAVDFDNDGDSDLIVNRNNGVFVYFNKEGRFTERKLPLEIPADTVPLSTAVGDIDLDGDFDIYVNMFVSPDAFRSAVFNDPTHARHNVLLRNDGNFQFVDITKQSNTAGKQNTFLSIFTDLNNDGRQDLLLAQNTGQVEVFQHNHDATFSPVMLESGYGFWMGIGLGDIDQDGDQDMLISNAGDSIPAFLTTGDLQENQRHNLAWLLLRNDTSKGEFAFSEQTKELGITEQGFAWGAVFEDLNFDGRLDLLVAENYIKWPVHKLFKLENKVYQATASGGFILNEDWGLGNKYFGQSPLIVDINNDLIPDVAWLNMDGPLRVFINSHSGNFLSVRLPLTAASAGARVWLEFADGKSYSKEWVVGTGMLTQQDTDMFFGLAEHTTIKRLIVQWANGTRTVVQSPKINTRLVINQST